MPFKSEKQRKWMHATKPEMAKKWEKKKKNEAFRPTDKKVLMVIGRDTINKLRKKNPDIDKPDKQLGQAINAIFRAMTREKSDANYKQYKKYFPKQYNDKLLRKLAKAYFDQPFNVQNTFMRQVMDYTFKESVNEAERDYKDEYKKFQSSTKSKKYRAELNKYNRKKGTYGNGDGKDASHKGGKIVGFESQSKNRGRAEKSRLKKESPDFNPMIDKILDEVIDEYQINEGTNQMTQVYKDLDKKFKNYDHSGIRDFNKVAKYLKTKFSKGSGLPDAIASFYNDYKSGEDMKKNINKLTKYAKKMKGYAKESVDESDLGLTYKKGKTVKV